MVLCKKRGLRELALFAGAGGGILGGFLLGWQTVAAVEIEEYPRAVLLQRQLDGILPPFPVWDDVCTFDGRPWRYEIDIITGGFPCQDISAAGKGAGLAGERSGLWSEMARIIGEVNPRFVLVENSPMLTSRGLDRVLMDLAQMGYDAKWGVLGACHVGAPHKRERIWVLANAGGGRRSEQRTRKREQPEGTETECPGSFEGANSSYTQPKRLEGHQRETGGPKIPEPGNLGAYVPDTNETRWYGGPWSQSEKTGGGQSSNCDWWTVEPQLDRVVNGLANRVDRIKAIGNGQVPAVVQLAWETLSDF